MPVGPSTWAAELRRTYFGNATSVRDFRVQMRGTKAFWIFTLYVLGLSLFGLMAYYSILGRTGISVAEAQSGLQGFYMSCIAILGGIICLIAPGLTSTAIVVERQRQSLDLVLSAPIQPKYLLVGKMVSSYRYTWMLLILALPIVAMSVVLGGATWSDVFGCFVLFSFQALVFTSIALYISSVTMKASSAVFWSLCSVGLFVLVSSIFGAATAAATLYGGSGTRGLSVSPLAGLNPFTVGIVAGTHSDVFGVHVPNWILVGLICFLIARLFLLAAAAALAPLDRKLTANLRISSFLYLLAISTYASAEIASSTLRYTPDVGVIGLLGLSSVSWLLLAMPGIACFGGDGSRRYWPNGRFKLRHLLDGTPAGGFPYVIALTLAGFGGLGLGLQLSSFKLSPPAVGAEPVVEAILAHWVYGVAFLYLIWAIGQYFSSISISLKSARAFHLTALLAIYAGLPALFSSMHIEYPRPETSPGGYGAWIVWPFTPLGHHPMIGPLFSYAGVFAVLGALISWRAQIKLAPKLRGSVKAPQSPPTQTPPSASPPPLGGLA